MYVPQSQRVRVKKTRQFRRVNGLGQSRIYTEEIVEDQSRWVMSFRTSMETELDRAGALQGSRAVWMMWPGYLQGEAGKRTVEGIRRRNIPLAVIHASGHASVEDLEHLAFAIDACKVIPIHTAAADRYPALFDNVEAHLDGEWWDV